MSVELSGWLYNRYIYKKNSVLVSVGFCSMRRGKVFDVSDPDLRRTLPQHDFNIPEVNVTPSSFRFLRMKVEDIEGTKLTRKNIKDNI